MNSLLTSCNNYLSRFDTRAVSDSISLRNYSTKSQKLNIVSARSQGNPKLNDSAVNNKEFGLTIQPCSIHNEQGLVTWKEIYKGNFESAENAKYKENLFYKGDDASSSLINFLKKDEVDLNSRITTWMSTVRKLDETFLIKDNDENLDIDVHVPESVNFTSPKCVNNVLDEESFAENLDKPISEQSPTEVVSSIKFNDDISFTSTPIANHFNEFSDKKCVSYQNLIENEFLSLEDLNSGDWEDFESKIKRETISDERIEFEPRDIVKKILVKEDEIEFNESNEEKNLLLSQSNELFSVRSKTSSSARREELSRQETQNTGNKDSSRQRSATYIIKEPSTIFTLRNKSPDESSLDFKVEKSLQKGRTDKDTECLDFTNVDKNVEDDNFSLESCLNSTIFDSSNLINIKIDESLCKIYENYVNQKINCHHFEENESVDISDNENQGKKLKIETDMEFYSLDSSPVSSLHKIFQQPLKEGSFDDQCSDFQLNEEQEIILNKENSEEYHSEKNCYNNVSHQNEKHNSVIENNFKKSNKEKESPENKLKGMSRSRSQIPLQITRTDNKLNINDQFWKKKEKKEKILNCPKENEDNFENSLAQCKNKKENIINSQINLDSKFSSSQPLLNRRDTISLSLPVICPSIQENEKEILEEARKSEEFDFLESNSKSILESKSLLSFKPHDYKSNKLNSNKIRRKICRSMNFLRGSFDSLISSCDEMESNSKSSSMADFFIDETCTIEEIRVPNKSMKCKLLPIIEKYTSKLVRKETAKNNTEDSYWERASRVSMHRLIGSEMVQAKREFKLPKRNPRVQILPPVVSAASGKMR